VLEGKTLQTFEDFTKRAARLSGFAYFRSGAVCASDAWKFRGWLIIK
jgi:hypothetical protein